MKNDTSKKGFYEENFLDIIHKIMLNRDKDKNNPFVNGLFLGTPSPGISESKLTRIKEALKNTGPTVPVNTDTGNEQELQ